MTDHLVASQVVLEALSLRCLIQSQILATPQRFVTFVLFCIFCHAVMLRLLHIAVSKRLSQESVEAYTTMPIGIMGSKRLALLD